MIVEKKKRQHFVPRFLLKKFSLDEKRIDVFYIEKKKLFPGVSLRDQCQSPYFYGKDGSLEAGFEKLETDSAPTIDKILNHDEASISSDDLFRLKQFVHYQNQRTKGAAKATEEYAAASVKNLLKKDVVSRGHDPNIVDAVELKLKNPQLMSLYGAAVSTPAVLDLKFKFLIAPIGKELFISDDPVITYNQYAEHHSIFSKCTGASGLVCKGIQLFLPLSPRICLALYDPTTYQFGSEKTMFGNMGKKDVHILNQLQAINADQCLYAKTASMWSDLDSMIAFRKTYLPNHRPTIQETPITRRPDGKFSQLITTSIPILKIDAKFSFSQIIDNHSYTDYTMTFMPPRSREIVEALEGYKKYIEGLRLERLQKSAGSSIPTKTEVDD